MTIDRRQAEEEPAVREASQDHVARLEADEDVHRLGVESVERWKNLLDRLAR